MRGNSPEASLIPVISDFLFVCLFVLSPSEHRCVESAKIRNKYPDRVPVIVEKVSGSQIVDIDKRKYLVPSDITVAQFMWIIRKRIQLPSEKAIFLFVDKTVPQSSLTMGQLYDKEKDEDGFLYVAYSGENTFGYKAFYTTWG
ncbi:hypothetical protein Q8A73_005020 [Channa argus]|nr:hypothetical protein Q8A73_005020 [Channa argus]